MEKHVGIHAHNDTEQAVANSLAAVRAGARQIQGTLNGLGERCGNANLVSIIPTLMSIYDSIRSQLVPITPEGYPFIGTFALASLILFWLWSPLGWLGTLATIWCAYFFRDPPRVTPVREGLVVAPADGRISQVTSAVPPTDLDLGSAPLPRISIFMLDLGMFGESDLGLDLACIGVENVAEAAGSPLNGFAPYKMANLTHGSHSSDLLKRPGNLRHFRLFWVDFAAFPQ